MLKQRSQNLLAGRAAEVGRLKLGAYTLKRGFRHARLKSAAPGNGTDLSSINPIAWASTSAGDRMDTSRQQ